MAIRHRGIRPALFVLWLVAGGFACAQQAPTINSGGVVNPGNAGGYNYPPDPITAGSIISIYGTNLGPPGGVNAPGPPLPVTLAETQVLINGIAAPLFFATAGQINAQVPWELAGASSVTVQAAVNGLLSNSVTVPLGIGAGIFVTVHSADGSYITSSNPAVPNEILTIYCTGLGPVTNQPSDGAAARANPLSWTTSFSSSNPAVMIEGIPAYVWFAGLTPGFAGLYQVNVQVPSNVTSGYSGVVLSAGTAFAGWDEIPVKASSSRVSLSSTVPGNLIYLRAGGGFAGTFQYSATVTGASNTAVLWSVNGIPGGNATVGTISFTGLYTSPDAVPNPSTVTIAAMSVADPTRGDSGTVTLYGPAATVSPLSLSMGVAAIASSVTQSVTLTNSGGDDLIIDAPSFSGANSTDFPVSMFSWGNCTTDLAPGLSCTFTISFAPTAAGVRSAAFQFNTDDPGGPQFINLVGIGASPGSVTTAVTLSPNVLNFGPVPLSSVSAEQTVTLTNTGGVPLDVTSLAVTGLNAADFAISDDTCPQDPATLAPGTNCTISVVFVPSLTSGESASLTISDNTSAGTQTITLAGSGSISADGAQPALSLSSTLLNYGAVPAGTSALQAVTLINSGATRFYNITGVTITGPNAADFTLSSNTCPLAPFSLPIGLSCAITVAAKPSTAATEAAFIQVSVDPTSLGADVRAHPNQANSQPYRPPPIPLGIIPRGAVPPALTVPSVQKWVVPFLTTVQETINVANPGTVAVYIGSITTVGDNFVIAPGSNCPGTLNNPGPLPPGSCKVFVNVTQSVDQTQLGALVVTSSAGVRQTILVSSGAGPFTLGVLTAGLGSGTVTIAPAPPGQALCSTPSFQSPKTCPPIAYAAGTWVTLTAKPGPNSVFLGWGDLTGFCGGLSNGTTCNFPMDQNKLILATFPAAGTELVANPPSPYHFAAVAPGVVNPANIVVKLTEQSGLPVAFRATPSVPWIVANPSVGVTPATVTITVNPQTAPTGNGDYRFAISLDGGSTFPTLTGFIPLPLPNAHASAPRDASFVEPAIVSGTLTVGSSPSQFALTVGSAGAGTGIVSLNPAGGIYAAGTVVTLTATPNNGSTFAGWSGACLGTGRCTVTMNSNLTVTATFNFVSAQQFSLTTNTSGTGSGTISSSPAGTSCGSGCLSFAAGTVVTLTATPNSGSTFAGWSGACSGTGTCTVTMNSNQTVTATFNLASAQQFTLTTTTAGNGSGTVSSSPTGTSCGSGCLSFAAGTVVTLTAAPNSGSTFAGWSGACSGSGTCTVTMNSNLTVTATFNLASAQQFSLTTTTSGTGSGTVSSSPAGTSCGSGCLSFAAGTVVTLTATPNSGSTFSGWSGACFGTGTCTLTINSNVTVTATFNLPAGGGALTGTWVGTWTDTEPGPQYSCVLTTTLTWNLTQTGASVTGTYTVLVTAGAPASLCSSSVGQSITGNFVQGTVSGSSVTLTTDANLNGIVFSGTAAGTSISGTGSNANEGGPFSVTHQ